MGRYMEQLVSTLFNSSRAWDVIKFEYGSKGDASAFDHYSVQVVGLYSNF